MMRSLVPVIRVGNIFNITLKSADSYSVGYHFNFYDRIIELAIEIVAFLLYNKKAILQ